MFFVRRYSKESQTYELHNVIEKMEGGDMRSFIKEHKKAFDLNQVRDISK